MQNGESWKVDNCTTASCINGNITEKPTQCATVPPPICANGHSPVKVYDDDGCCFQYECGCKLKTLHLFAAEDLVKANLSFGF